MLVISSSILSYASEARRWGRRKAAGNEVILQSYFVKNVSYDNAHMMTIN